MAEITSRDAARDGMGCIIDRWDGEERQTGLDAEHDQRTALADSLIDYLISTGWHNDDPIGEKAISEHIDEVLEGVPYDDEFETHDEVEARLRETGRDEDLDDEETGAIIERGPHPDRAVHPDTLQASRQAEAGLVERRDIDMLKDDAIASDDQMAVVLGRIDALESAIARPIVSRLGLSGDYDPGNDLGEIGNDANHAAFIRVQEYIVNLQERLLACRPAVRYAYDLNLPKGDAGYEEIAKAADAVLGPALGHNADGTGIYE